MADERVLPLSFFQTNMEFSFNDAFQTTSTTWLW